MKGLSPAGGKLSGDKARPVMMASKLPVDALGKIWNLSDIDRDGQLDAEEFAVVSLCMLCVVAVYLVSYVILSLLFLCYNHVCTCRYNNTCIYIKCTCTYIPLPPETQ